MEIEELMIGDWVNETYEAVDGNMYEQEKRVGYYDLNDVKYFTPIPITPDILKKNGFEKPNTFYTLKIDSIRKPILIRFLLDEENSFIDIDNDSFCVMGDIKYIHELQHALRLCKIEKEIIL